MLQSIREIGIFMVVAQAVVHFAPGRQYEKYIKTISNVIILLLFLKPFVQMAGQEWQPSPPVPEWLTETAELPDFSADSVRQSKNSVEGAVKQRMEKEIAVRLNRELADDPCQIQRVELKLREGDGIFEEESFFSVKIVIGEQAADDGQVLVKEISIGEKEAREEALEAYRLRFAGLLEMEKEQVEVRWDGRD